MATTGYATAVQGIQHASDPDTTGAPGVVLGGPGVDSNAALATTATQGFVHIPTTAGAPTGVPDLVTGFVPIVFDVTNHRLYVYENAGWHYFDRTA